MGIASVKPDCDIIGINPSSHAEPLLKSYGCVTYHADQYRVSDIEMMTFESPPYTSLKDLMQSSPPSSPPSWLITSPGNGNGNGSGGSWREIPIKDPLLQHAAWAYLMPMSADAQGPHGRNLMQKMKDRCGGIFGCLNEVVMVMIKNWVASFSR